MNDNTGCQDAVGVRHRRRLLSACSTHWIRSAFVKLTRGAVTFTITGWSRVIELPALHKDLVSQLRWRIAFSVPDLHGNSKFCFFCCLNHASCASTSLTSRPVIANYKLCTLFFFRVEPIEKCRHRGLTMEPVEARMNLPSAIFNTDCKPPDGV